MLNLTGSYTGTYGHTVPNGDRGTVALNSASLVQSGLTLTGHIMMGATASGTFEGTLSDLTPSARFVGSLRVDFPPVSSAGVACGGNSGMTFAGPVSPNIVLVAAVIPYNVENPRCQESLRDVTVTLIRQ